MADPRDVPEKPARPSPLGILAASLPPVFAGMALVLVFVFAGIQGRVGDVFERIQETGFWFYGIVLAALLSIATLSVLLVLAARGRRIPVAAMLAAAVMPWLVGIAGQRAGFAMVAGAVTEATPDMRAVLIARGVAESMNARLLSAWTSAALLAATAFGLALAALARPSEDRKPVGAAVGLAGVALLAAPVMTLSGGNLAAFLPWLPALGGVVACVLAGLGAGGEDRGRSAALAAGVPLAAALAVGATAVVTFSLSSYEVFAAIATVAPDTRGEVVAAAAAELEPLQRASLIGTAAGLIPALALGGWAITRARPGAGAIAGAVAAVLVTAGTFALDSWAHGAGTTALAAMAGPSWGPDFEPMVVSGDEGLDEVDLLLTAQGPVHVDGSRLGPPGDAEALREAIRQLAAERNAIDERRDPFLGYNPEVEPEPPPPADPHITVAVDRRVTLDALRALFGAAARAGVVSIQLQGAHPDSMSREAREVTARTLPVMAAFLEQRGAVTVRTQGGLPEGFADQDSLLLHTTVGAVSATRLEPRASASATGVSLPCSLEDRAAREETETAFAYLGVAPDATPASLIESAGRAASCNLSPVLCFGPIPGNPERAAAPDPMETLGGLLGQPVDGIADADSGPQSIGGLQDVGSADANAPRVRTGSSEVRGSLPREVIQRIIRRHLNEARFCYEQALARDPTLEGRVTIRFVISPTGAVTTAAVQDSDLGSASAERCLVTAVRRWTFPAPDGGGIVMVSYPFVFTSSAGH